MIEWFVRYQYIDRDGEEFLIVLPSFRKLLWWFVRTGWRCSMIHIFMQ